MNTYITVYKFSAEFTLYHSRKSPNKSDITSTSITFYAGSCSPAQFSLQPFDLSHPPPLLPLTDLPSLAPPLNLPISPLMLVHPANTPSNPAPHIPSPANCVGLRPLKTVLRSKRKIRSNLDCSLLIFHKTNRILRKL